MRTPPKIKIVEGRPTPSLPVELLNKIFALCSTETQKKLSLLSRSILHILRPHLFSTSTIRTTSQFEELVARVKASDIWAGYLRSLWLGFVDEEQEGGDKEQRGLDRQSQLLEVLGRCSGLQHFSVQLASVDESHITPAIITAILDHPSLRTFSFGAFSSSWVPTSTHLASSSSSSQRSRPLLIPHLYLNTKVGEPFEPLLQFIVERGIHVRELNLDQLSMDRLDRLRSFLSIPLPTLEILNMDFGYDRGIEYSLPQDLFLSIIENYPSLRTIAYHGEQDWVGRSMLSLLGQARGLESLSTFEMDSWWKESDFYHFQLDFVETMDGSLRIEEFGLSVTFGEPRPSLQSFLKNVHACFPDLMTLRLGGSTFPMPKPGGLHLPHGLLPHLQHLTLPTIYFDFSSTGAFLPLQSSSCPHHPRLSRFANGLEDQRAQEIADSLNLAGGPSQYWNQENLPRIESDIVRVGRAFPSLRTVEQTLEWDWAYPLYVWDLERRQEGGVEGVRAILRPGEEEDLEAVGYCTCGADQLLARYRRSDPGVEEWWAEQTFKTPLFDLEPNFFPAFTLDSFFPLLPRTSPPS